ncbi:hypothetical protein LQW54_000058 [Pestalotiopsis sp. IQ-011]
MPIITHSIEIVPEWIPLPHPAVKCVIGHYIEVFEDLSWACVIVGSFYDDKDKELWHTEVIVKRRARRTRSQSRQQRLTHSTPAFTAFNHPWLDYQSIQQPTTVFPAFNNQVSLFPPQLNRHLFTMSGNPNHGWDPATGFDGGALPQGSSFAGYGGYPTMPVAGYAVGAYDGFAMSGMTNGFGVPAPPYTAMPGPPGSVGPVYTMPANGYQHPVPVFPNQPGGPRFPTAHPVVRGDAPALNMQNSTGGMGCEPGYNYYFPAEHTKIHVLHSSVPPWRLAHGMNTPFTAYHVPVTTTIGEMMKGWGASNPNRKKNRITEVTPGGEGRFYKGSTFSGDEKDDLKMTAKDLGWDLTRSGRPGEKAVVWLWVTKD